jgi:hypothetical protein
VIELTGKPGNQDCHIKFTPRAGFKRTHRPIERELVYGHYCPRCMNVVQALFLTDEPVNLWPYEETNVMSTSKSEEKIGTILKIVPNGESKAGYTNYTVTPLRGAGERGQHIVLKNHVLKYHGIEQETHTTDRYFEPGERTCEYAGAFALREDLLIRDVCHFMRLDVAAIEAYTLPSVEDFLKGAVEYDFRSLPAYGSAPPVVLFPREWLAQRRGQAWQLRSILQPCAKPKETNVAA